MPTLSKVSPIPSIAPYSLHSGSRAYAGPMGERSVPQGPVRPSICNAPAPTQSASDTRPRPPGAFLSSYESANSADRRGAIASYHVGAGDKYDAYMEAKQGIRARGLSELQSVDADLYHDTTVAIRLAHRLTQLAASTLSSGNTDQLSLICGNHSVPQALAEKVISGFTRIGNHLDGMRRGGDGREQLVFLRRDDKSSPSVGEAAPTDPHKRIFLSPCFDRSSIIQKALTLIHESSHIALGTEDEHYFGQGYFRYDVIEDARLMREEIKAHASSLPPSEASRQFLVNADSWAFLAALIGFEVSPENMLKVADQERMNQ